MPAKLSGKPVRITLSSTCLHLCNYLLVQLWVPGEVLTVSAGDGAPEISVQTSLPPRVPLIVPGKEVLPMNQVSDDSFEQCMSPVVIPGFNAEAEVPQRHGRCNRSNRCTQQTLLTYIGAFFNSASKLFGLRIPVASWGLRISRCNAPATTSACACTHAFKLFIR